MVVLKPIEDPYIAQLADILNTDLMLASTLSSNTESITAKQFNNRNNEWARKHNALLFAIVLNGTAIGMISLSYIDMTRKTAQIGYWLASNHWNRGHMTSSFKLIMGLAKQTGIDTVTATIDSSNAVSKAIWEKYGANFVEVNGQLKAFMQL